jgi:hypothetical protein
MYCLLLSGILLCFAKQSGAETAGEMVSACRAIEAAEVQNNHLMLPQDFKSGQCWGAFGVLQAVTSYLNPDKTPMLSVCATHGTRTQMIAIFISYVARHPATYNKDFELVALASLMEEYPCRK